MAAKQTWVQKALGACLALSVFSLGTLHPQQAFAHAEHGSEGGVPTVVSQLPKTVQLSVAKSAAYQFALSTNGQHTVLVYGEDQQRPFLKIQGQRVQADVHSTGWHRAQQPGGGAIPPSLKENPNMPARWVPLADDGTVGWYDPRLQQEDLLSFNLKLSVDGKIRQVEVARVEAPKMDGFWRPVVTHEPDHPNLFVMVPGLSGNALMLSNNGGQTVAVLDAQGQPFLRVGANGTWLKHTHGWAKDLGLYFEADPQQDWAL
ncbi:hypothetical protein, partial [Limnobacter sp.]|uniref:hypothetical protein n=1 Tax=Limnobacter sp. TaxID=2003368 RepID=UPI003514839B